ncbi:MAG TPA: mechanosensitive ion channel domain-containing protein [Balneolales bacterium]|nr:mechanosensitive ion channel domain-containing protein [Balneolales bacterium]
MNNDIQSIWNSIVPLLTQYGLQVIGAIVILIVGWAISGWFGKKTRKMLEKSMKMDATLIPILANLVRYLGIIFTILMVLNNFGVQTASIIAVLGAAGLAVGLALQGSLSNVASGVMLLVFRPFKVGDVVEAGGVLAVIDEIGLFLTKLHTFDNINVYQPNSKIWGTEIRNYSQNETRRVDIPIGIGYGDDIDHALKVVKEVVEADARTLPDPAPMFAVSDLGDSSVNLMVRFWTKSGDFFNAKLDLTKELKQRFDKEGINIPFPQRDVHLYQVSKS